MTGSIPEITVGKPEVLGRVVDLNPPSLLVHRFGRRRATEIYKIVAGLGPNYEYDNIRQAAEANQQLRPEVRQLMFDTVEAGKALKNIRALDVIPASLDVGTQEFLHTMTAGIIKAPEVTGRLSPGSEAFVRFAADFSAIGVQGMLGVLALNKITGLPSINAHWMKLPARVRNIVYGGALGTLEALRPEGVPDETVPIDIPGKLAGLVTSPESSMIAQRLALAGAGAMTGGIIGEVFGPIVRGYRWAKESYIAREITPAQADAIRRALSGGGVPVRNPDDVSELYRTFVRNMGKVSQSGDIAATFAQAESRGQYVAQLLYNDPGLSGPPILRQTAVLDPKTNLPKMVFHGSRKTLEGRLQVSKADRYGLLGENTAYFTDGSHVASEYSGIFRDASGAVSHTIEDVGGSFYETWTARLSAQRNNPAEIAKLIASQAEDEMRLIRQAPQPDGSVNLIFGSKVTPNVQPYYLDIRNPLLVDSEITGEQAAEFGRFIRDETRRNLLEEGVGNAKFADMMAAQSENAFNRLMQLEDRKSLWTLMEYIHGVRPARVTEDLINALPYDYGRMIAKFARSKGFDGLHYPGGRILGGGDHNVWVAFNDAQIIPAFANNDELLLASIFRTNPGGISVARDVVAYRSAESVAKTLGFDVTVHRVGNDALIVRPGIQWPTLQVGSRFKRNLDALAEHVRTTRGGKATTKSSVLPDGRIIRGEYNPTEIANRLNIQAPIIAGQRRNDWAVRETLNLVDVEFPASGKVTVTLPTVINQVQASTIAQMVDRLSPKGLQEITLVSARVGVSRTITNPIGFQVEDALVDLVQGATKTGVTEDLTRKMTQFKSEGVFAGQAGVLPDGYVVEVQRRLFDKKTNTWFVKYKDMLTGEKHLIPETNLTILPTSIQGEFTPNNFFLDALPEAERNALARLRRAINEDLAKPITTFHQLEDFASTRGFFAKSIGKGQVALTDPNAGTVTNYRNIKAAVEAVRNQTGPLPDLTPPEMKALLGGGGPPAFGGGWGGAPPRFGESLTPIPDGSYENYAKVLTQTGPGWLQTHLTPSRGLFMDLERQYDMPFGRVWDNINTQTTHRQNFLAGWVEGKGPYSPSGVTPLHKIFQIAGRNADERAITAWLEAADDPILLKEIEAGMSSREIRAATELRSFYNTLFETFGIEADFITAYAPHFRRTADELGNDIVNIWRRTKTAPLPKSVEFFADYARDGMLNLYEDRAFVAALKYLEIGSHNRYLKEPMTQAKRLLKAIPDRAVKGPLSHYIEALRGMEFVESKAMMESDIYRLMQYIGVSEGAAKNVSEKLVLNLLGLSYNATMSFRPGLVLRNLSQTLQTTWTMFGGFNDDIAEGIGRAMTTVGRDEAIVHGAISIKTGAVFAAEEIDRAMPKALKAMSDAGMRLYNGSDHFNRAVAFHTVKIRAGKALARFADEMAEVGPAGYKEAKRNLIRNSGAYVMDTPVVNEFLRRAAESPVQAAAYLGKHAADATQWLYGRGNQVQWMRSIPGRFLGQFGTWPLWYIDFMRRTTRNMWRAGFKSEAALFVARTALVNMAVVVAGKEAFNLNTWRWSAWNSWFYTGGPGLEILSGVGSIVRGTGELFEESDYGRTRIAHGSQILERAGTAFIPLSGVVRDIDKILNARTPTEVAAAILGGRPTREYTIQQQLELLINQDRMSTDIELEHGGDSGPTAAELKTRMMESELGQERMPQWMGGGMAPIIRPTAPPGGMGQPQGPSRASVGIQTPVAPRPRPYPGESKPIPQ